MLFCTHTHGTYAHTPIHTTGAPGLLRTSRRTARTGTTTTSSSTASSSHSWSRPVTPRVCARWGLPVSQSVRFVCVCVFLFRPLGALRHTRTYAHARTRTNAHTHAHPYASQGTPFLAWTHGAFTPTHMHTNSCTLHTFLSRCLRRTGDGTGGESIWGGEFEDEFHPNLRHDRPYTLSMGKEHNLTLFVVRVSLCGMCFESSHRPVPA